MAAPEDLWTNFDHPDGHAYAQLLQRALKGFVRTRRERRNEEKEEMMIDKITMSTQTEGLVSPNRMTSMVSKEAMGPWTDSLPQLRVLLIFSNPSNTHPLRLQAEEKCIRDALRGGKYGDRVLIDVLPACTIDDLARQLLSNTYEVIHFSGHADRSSALVKHTIGLLVGEHNVEHTNFRDAGILKRVELAAEEVVKQLEEGLAGHSPLTHQSTGTAPPKSCTSSELESGSGPCIVMHGRLHGEKIIRHTTRSLLCSLSPTPPSSSSTVECKTGPRGVFLPVDDAQDDATSPSALASLSRAMLSITNLQVKLKDAPRASPADPMSPLTSTTPTPASTPIASCLERGASVGSDKDELSEVNLVKHFSHRDLLDIGVGSLAFEGEHGHMAYVSPYTFAALLANHCPPLQCVILNACGGHIQGEILASVVPQTVCFSGRVSDQESLIFSRGFYDSIAHGHSVNKAFRDGSARMELHALSPGVPNRRDTPPQGGPGRLPLVTLLRNEQLYQALHACTVEVANRAIMEKDAKLQAENSALLSENDKLRSLITYGMELLQSKDKDLDAMRSALSVLAASTGGTGGGKKGKGHLSGGHQAVVMGLLENLAAGTKPVRSERNAGEGRKNSHGGGGDSGGVGGSSAGKKRREGHVRWKHVSTPSTGTAGSTAKSTGPAASKPMKKPKWYKNVQSSGYGKVSFSASRKEVNRGSGGVHASPHRQEQCLHAVPLPAPPTLSPSAQGRRRSSTAQGSSFPRPSSARSDSGETRRRRHLSASPDPPRRPSERDDVVVVEELDDVDPPVLSAASSAEHTFSSSLVEELNDEDVEADAIPPPPAPHRLSKQSSHERRKAQGGSSAASKRRGNGWDTPPRPPSAPSRPSLSAPPHYVSHTSSATAPPVPSPKRSQALSLQKQSAHAISKPSAWAKAYPAGDGDNVSGLSSSHSGQSVPRTSKLSRPRGEVKGNASEAGSTTRSTSAFREKSAGFREFVKEMRTKQAAQKPTSSFASSVPRFDNSSSATSNSAGLLEAGNFSGRST